MYLIYWVGPTYGNSNILIYIAICSLIGSLSVMGCKGLSIALKLTLGGDSQLQNPLTWFFAISVAVCITVQMNYLNKSLDIFNTSLVTPIYYVMFTTLTITASAILFREWEKLTNRDVLGAICGFLTIVFGVFLLHAFRDLNFGLMDLLQLMNQQSSAGGSSSTSRSSSTCGVVGAGPGESLTLQTAHRTASFARSNHHGSQTTLHMEELQRTNSVPRGVYLTNGNPDSEEEELFTVETSQLIHSDPES